MHSELKDGKNDWSGIWLSASRKEVSHLIGQLQKLLYDPGQHFYISSSYKASSGLGNIEIPVKDELEPDNLFLSGLALVPGAGIHQIPFPPAR